MRVAVQGGGDGITEGKGKAVVWEAYRFAPLALETAADSGMRPDSLARAGAAEAPDGRPPWEVLGLA
jgi:hypothetical protein